MSNAATFITSLALGIGLAAACGFRVFVPLFFISIAARAGQIALGPGWDWVGGLPALVTLATATAVEIGAYYVPWLDNLLDTVATPAAVVAGTVVTAAAVGDVSPLLKWSIGIIAGGTVAGAVQVATTAIRAASTATTGGMANPVVSTAEVGGSVALSLLALLLPIAALLAVALLMFAILRFFYRRFRGARRAAAG